MSSKPFRQSGTTWLGGRKVGKEKNSGKHPTFAIPSPDQPPLRLMFDILMFSYLNKKINIKQSPNQLSLKDKGLTNTHTKSGYKLTA